MGDGFSGALSGRFLEAILADHVAERIVLSEHIEMTQVLLALTLLPRKTRSCDFAERLDICRCSNVVFCYQKGPHNNGTLLKASRDNHAKNL